MPVQSMTGFATKTISLMRDKEHKATVSIHLKSLNARYFELNAKLPLPLSHLETELLKLFKEKLHRGYVSYTIFLDNPAIFKGAIEPALSTVESYVDAIERIKKKLSLRDPIALEMVLRLPNIFNVEEQPINKQSAQAILKASQDLVKAIIKEREKEGAILKKDIEKRIAIMKSEIHEIEKRSEKLVDEQKKKIGTMLTELRSDESDAAETRRDALYLTLNKMGINEEIVRFQSHLDNIITHLNSGGIEKGKRLDFTLQELMREINTITAKSPDHTISEKAINIKVETEKIREQVQNIV